MKTPHAQTATCSRVAAGAGDRNECQRVAGGRRRPIRVMRRPGVVAARVPIALAAFLPLLLPVGLVGQVVGPIVGPIRATPLEGLQMRIEQHLGPAPASCGQFVIQAFGRPPASLADLRAAAACVDVHRASRTPAWLVVQRQGIDSWVGYGLLVTRDGEVRRFSYDSDPSGGSGVAPRLSTEPCPTVRVTEDVVGWTEISCGAP